MLDYKKMYHILCAAASGALDELPETPDNATGRDILQNALYEAEELYISAENEPSVSANGAPMKAQRSGFHGEKEKEF